MASIKASLPAASIRMIPKSPAAKPPGTGSIRWVNPCEEPGWDARLAAHAGSSLFHSSAWARVLQTTYGFNPLYLAKQGPDGSQVLWPLIEVESWLTGRRGVALPFTDDCEPLVSGPDSTGDVVRRMIDFGKSRNWKYIEFRGGANLFAGTAPSLTFHGHKLELSGGESALFARVESSVRRAVRKAEKEGVVVEITRSLEAVETFYALHCETRKKHGTPPQPIGFFRNIHKHILARDLGMIAVARHQDRPVAANVYFHLGNEAIYKYGASDERFQHLRGSNLVMWEAVKWLASQGAKTLNLGRTSLANEGLRRFKLGWGCTEQRIDYFKYDLRAGRFVKDRDEASGWHNRVFSALPVPLSRMIGAVLYRHVA